MKCFTIIGLPQTGVYSNVLSGVLRFATTCSLTIRPSMTLSTRGQEFIREAARDLAQEEQKHEWPGTRLLVGKAKVLTYTLSPRFRELFAKNSVGLSSWMHPELPEDPAFFRGDGSLIFGSVSHENDAFLELTDEELPFFQACYGNMQANPIKNEPTGQP